MRIVCILGEFCLFLGTHFIRAFESRDEALAFMRRNKTGTELSKLRKAANV